MALAEPGFDVFGSISRKGDFKIVDERCAVHRDSSDEAALHQIDQDRTEADLNDVSADAPEDGSALFARNVNRAEEIAKIFRRKNVGQ